MLPTLSLFAPCRCKDCRTKVNQDRLTVALSAILLVSLIALVYTIIKYNP